MSLAHWPSILFLAVRLHAANQYIKPTFSNLNQTNPTDRAACQTRDRRRDCPRLRNQVLLLTPCTCSSRSFHFHPTLHALFPRSPPLCTVPSIYCSPPSPTCLSATETLSFHWPDVAVITLSQKTKLPSTWGLGWGSSRGLEDGGSPSGKQASPKKTSVLGRFIKGTANKMVPPPPPLPSPTWTKHTL